MQMSVCPSGPNLSNLMGSDSVLSIFDSSLSQVVWLPGLSLLHSTVGA